MICFPNAKINLGLRVLRKRSDGYHDLESVLYPVPFFDVLEFLPADTYQLKTWGPDVGEGDNLVTRTWHLLHKKANLPPLKVHLLKHIPTGAGLGGGSSDAAFFLKETNRIFGLGLSQGALLDLAAEIGSDCPFFIDNQPSLIRGRGEIIEPMEAKLNGYNLILVFPGIHLSTREIFSKADPCFERPGPAATYDESIQTWKEGLKNDFENVVFGLHPELQKIKAHLYEAGAIYASLTGTGSALFGIFRNKPFIPDRLKAYTVRWLQL
jgi:4-diphosphocytidyl-2-C-methyl-D-erythritol kinase